LFACGALLLLVPALAAQEVPLPRDDIADIFLPATPPLGLAAEVPHPKETPPTPARFRLGRRLFFDPVLSSDRKVSCASCHDPDHGFTRPEPLPLGVHKRRAKRNAPTLLNRAFGRLNSWDGRARSLERQVLMPIENPVEMDLPLPKALGRLEKEGNYRREFSAVFDDGLTEANLGRALAIFVRGLMTGDSPVDRFRSGNAKALSTAARGGLWIFESKGRCWRCHSGPNFTDELFHNTGIGAKAGEPEEGRRAITGKAEDRGRFKTPTLRGLTLTAPYMHDGSLTTLEEVVEFYRRGGRKNSNLDPHIRPLNLDDRDARNLVAFLRALSPLQAMKK
jgi:cytochrome c peroxidase